MATDKIPTLDNFDLNGKTIYLRVDINQAIDRATETLKDISRIKACQETIKECSDKGAKVVIFAHQGSDIEYHNYYSTKPHAKVLSELLGREVTFIPDVCGPYAIEAIKSLQPGEIILLDNVRFMAEEMTIFETTLKLTREEMAQTQIVKRLSPYADLFVNDAFAAAHRAQPTLMGFTYYLPSAVGRLFEKEYNILNQILQQPKKPLVFVMGGAKIQDAFLMMNKVLADGIVNTILTGGLLANIMLVANGVEIGHTSMNFLRNKELDQFIEPSKKLLKQYGDKIQLPVDLAYVSEGRKNVDLAQLPVSEAIIDIGEKTVKKYQEVLNKAETVFVNGPMGIFEEADSEYGTKSIWEALAKSSAFTVFGGGDSVAAVNKYGLASKMDYLCTGGGAMVRFMSGEELPVIAALKNQPSLKKD